MRYAEKIPEMKCMTCDAKEMIHAGTEMMPSVGRVVRVLCTSCGATVTRLGAYLDFAINAIVLAKAEKKSKEITIPGPKTDETDEETEGQPSSDS